MEMKRAQSPDYPAISLKEAVERCRRLYVQIQGHSAPRQIVVQGMGFNTMHGGAMTALASMRKYGLLVKSGDTLRVSDLAKRILFPKSELEKADALEEAALKPALFAELYETFGPTPPSEMLVTNHLVRSGFLANAAKLAVNSYANTLPYIRGKSLVGGNQGEYDSNSEADMGSDDDEGSDMPTQQLQERPVGSSSESAALKAGVAGIMKTLGTLGREDERRIFDYDFEAAGGVGVVVRGLIDTEEALDVIGAWIDLKRKELARKALKLEASPQKPPRKFVSSLDSGATAKQEED